ncbi:MAG: TonB-dependent receptor [Novosphingobium sp. 28-62-57]|uniref:TonB-dependent receptor domain-containing protein n=1 Tax=unclassified Novosphingobium TaxID=2644732 RepID=UPI000BD50CC9|nr:MULTISPECIES: TonB-dependent receptor [unclassified Novosphingobium]OYW49521.1 MAG: TonB-dependent receptor [Novosphingobium sp. 12-62-10]OYZ12523.1 MAG: TonB-dependent receptor [Novosphingobium sp. 28-62-57]OZA34100.1 MAG: TonB-dependent receptor [Novosphingobium sp. 17-62-9]HQS68702.1 TonB-dependent receptor [Novosphingobium sp.]
MKRFSFHGCASFVALSAAMVATPAFAQDAAQAEAAPEAVGLDAIVVTASGRDKTQLNSAVSVSSISADTISALRPTSEAEIFRAIPGIQVAGTAGPGGNSNIAVRGLPVATGGSPFVQIQEDGLPTVLFGDIQFGNNDYWTRFDASVANVEGVRGGSAGTFASQAPGAVINYISHTGKQEGGFIAVNRGIGYDETRADFRYGGPINDTLYFHVGGYVKNGRGPLKADYTLSDSFQVKGSLTKEFNDGRGYFRMLFKVADTQEPNYTGSPALATINGRKITDVRPFPGFDGRDSSNYSIYNQDFLIYNREGNLERVRNDGITTKAQSFGNQFHYEFDGGITVDNNLRYTSMSGAFTSPFLNVGRTANVLGSTVNGSTVAAIRYASGPRAGQLYTDTYLDDNVNVRTKIRDIGSFANDLAVAGKFDVISGKLTTRAGLFYMNQKIAMEWNVNKSLRELNGDNPSQLDLFDNAGNKLTQAGQSGYNNNWGECCSRDYDLSYANTAPYLSLDFDHDQFGVDGSVRFERVNASGYAIGGGATFNVNSNGVNIPTITSNGVRENLDYTRSYTSWTVGALFKATPNITIFARTSRGGRFNSDRQTLGGKIRNDGALCTSGDIGRNGCTADGVTPSVDFVTQHELGVKSRGDLLGGRFTMELTLLKGNFKQSTFELSATRCPGGAGGCVIDAKFKSTGAEFFATYRNGGFSFTGNATYSKAKRQGAGATTFTRSPNLPDLIYTASANYDIGEIATLGLAMTGQTSSIDDAQFEYPGKAIFNPSIRVYPIQNLELGLQVYNVFDTFDLRGNGNVVNAGVTPTVISGTPALGRTVSASVRYNF